MKKSNQLLLSLLAITLLAIIATSMILKTEFEKIDQHDPFYGYAKEIVPPFKAVHLQGNYPGLIQLQPGDSFEIRLNKVHLGKLQWKVQGDTLSLSYPYPTPKNPYPDDYAFFSTPSIYIMAPKLSAVYSQGISCKLSGWQAAEWTLKQEGHQSGMLLSENTIGHLSADVAQGGLLQLAADNHMGNVEVQVKDTSTFVAAHDVIDSLRINIDSTANVKLPGSLLFTLAPQ